MGRFHLNTTSKDHSIINHLPLAILVSLVFFTSQVRADLITSTTDLFEGATIVSATAPFNSSFDSSLMFQGASPETEGVTLTIFSNVGLNNSAFVNFKTASPTTLNTIRLTAAHDDYSLDRAMNRFKLFADVNGDTNFETTLIDQEINPDYSKQSGNDGSTRYLDMTFTFATTTAMDFRAEFFEGTDLPNPGVRVLELDAFNISTVPEPSSAAFFCLAGVGTLMFSRRKRLFSVN